MRVTYTHKGWLFGLVPVYLAELESWAPRVEPRRWVPEWWCLLGESLFAGFCWVSSLVNPAFEPAFPILVTGELERPLVFEVDDHG